MAPMKVYGWTVSPWMARVLVCLEDYEVVPMSKSGGDHRLPEHLARNLNKLRDEKQSSVDLLIDGKQRVQPFGEIPVLEDDGDLTLYQSRAIARYILRKYMPELLREGDLAESAMVDVWVDVEANQVGPVLRAIVVHCLINPHIGCDRDQAIVDENICKLRALLEVYEARLSSTGSRNYLVGDAVSLADLIHFGFMRYFMASEYACVVDAYPRVREWRDTLLARPSAQKVMAAMPPDLGLGSHSMP